MNELHDLLHRATDRVESPRLEQVALQVARRRRTRRRGVAAAVAASVAAVAVVVGTQGLGRDGTPAPQPAAPSRTVPTPTPTPAPTATEAEDVVDDPAAVLVSIATSPTDPDVRAAVWRTCLDDSCGSLAVAVALTTDGFETRAVADEVWRTIPQVRVAPSGDVLVSTYPSRVTLEVVRPDGSVSEVRRATAPSPVAPGEVVGGVDLRRATTYLATDTATAVTHPVPVPEDTVQLDQTPTGQLRATTRDGVYAWSDDGGATWQQAAGLDVTKLHMLARSAPDVHVVVDGSDGATLFPFDAVRTLEDADSWSVVKQPAGERAYLELPPAVLPDGRLLLDVQGFSDDRPGGLWVSDGADWASYSRVASGAPFDADPRDIPVLDMQVDDDAVTIVAAGPAWHDAWVSDDGGVSWTPFGAR